MHTLYSVSLYNRWPEQDGHLVRFEFALGIRDCGCVQRANKCLFLNLEDILGVCVGERVTFLTEGRGIEKSEVQHQRGRGGSPCSSREGEELLEAAPCFLNVLQLVLVSPMGGPKHAQLLALSKITNI